MSETTHRSRRLLLPGDQVPPLELPLVGGGVWSLAAGRPRHYTLVVFYRGLHCPHCRRYLQSLQNCQVDFEAIGIDPVAVSGDTSARAEQAKGEWSLDRLPIAFGQKVESMRAWGLYLTEAILPSHPPIFGEPGLFVVAPDGRLYLAAIGSVPFGRPPLDELLSGLAKMIENNYPARGAA